LFLLGLVALLWPTLSHAQDADCADVKIVIEQKLSLERQAFDAHMVIRNGLQDALTDVTIELTYLDQNQQPVIATTDPNAVGAAFFERLDSATGINSLTGGTLAGSTTADIHWMLIPSQGAGGNTATGQLYYIGAKVSYTLAGQTTSVDVTPDYIVVRPLPLLVLDYFLPADVYADDPFTPQLEPPVPFTLGVRIANIGAGTSANTSIESAQPKIVDNQQGLLIDFQILGGYVGNDMVGKSLLLDFGDIPGQQAKVGRWIMQTTLSGRFIEFNASFTHADSLGGAVTSLIQSVNTHTLVHDVLIDLPGSDDIYDFLAQAGTGYRVYGSDGFDADVADASAQASLSSVSGASLRLTFPASPSLVHVQASDPFRGSQTIARVVRSDGKVLPAQNAWLSKTRNADLSWSYYLHIFDSNSTGQYTLEFAQGAQASIAGTAYQDANGNGVRDAGEPPEGNLGITLKGIDIDGQNVLLQTWTDPAGAFSFAGLAPGTYQIEAAVLDGWIDGVWQAGSAGGSVQPGLIKDIVLTAGAAGQGYLIAKRKPSPSQNTDQADLSIAIQANPAQLHGGQSADITVTVHNAGPDAAQNAAAQVLVPAGLTLQGNTASLGSYSGGVWTLGGLNAGQEATLNLQVKADDVTQDRAISWPVSVSASTADPQNGNNSALVGLTVLAEQSNTLAMTQELPPQARVLMLLACPQTDAQDQAVCEQQAAQQAQATMAGRVKQLQTVATLAAWNAAQRGNQYNVLWLHGGAEKLDDQALAELNAAVRRGATVIADGLPGPASGPIKLDQLADILGAQIVSPALGDSGQTVQFASEPTQQPVAGALYGLQLRAATQEMAQSGGTPVMTSATWGQGQAWTLGFDLLATLQGPAPTFWNAYAGQQILAFTPVSRIDPALAGARLPLKTTVNNSAPDTQAPQNASVQVQLPAGMTYADPEPAPASADSQQAQWNWQLASGQSQDSQLQLILPNTSGQWQVQTTLQNDQGQALDIATQAITVIGLDELTAQADSDLSALSSSDPAAQALIAQARQAEEAAKTAQQQGDWGAALTALAQLQAALAQLADPAYGLTLDTALLDVARWIGLAQQNWTQPATPHAARLAVQSGSGQSATVDTAFASPLVALVQDDQGQPLAGVTVRFTAPDHGASASFAGSANAEAVTDDQGLATSPAPMANAIEGSYGVTAEVDGLAAVSFELTNTDAASPPIATPAELRLISGGNQTTEVGSEFSAPMVVQVLDQNGQPLPGIAVQFAFAAAGPSASFAGNLSATVNTGDDGQASSPVFAANLIAGAHQASVTVAGLADTLTIDLNNSPAAPTLQLQAASGMNQSAAAGTAYGQPMTVRVVDGQGNPQAGVAVQFQLPASGPSAIFGVGQIVASVHTAADGTATSPYFVAGQQGDFQAQVSADGVAQPLYGAFTNLVADNSGKSFQGVPVTGGGVMIATVSGGGDTCVFNPSQTQMIAADGELSVNLKPFKLPYGLFEFELIGCVPGSTVTISTTWPDLKGASGYVKHGQPGSNSNAIWYVPGSMSIKGNTITYSIQDGGKGDDDLTANGIIRDPGGPATGLLPDDDNTMSIPALDAWALALLAALLAAIGTIARRRT
jgi:uncharacterized repeat protein (TIGR01451 family)